MKRLLLLLAFVVMAAPFAMGQSWQWGIRGGSASDPWSTGSSHENVRDLATDRNGNVYFASAFTTGTNASLGHSPVTTYNSPGYNTENLIVASYSCNGSLRWKKLIGGVADCTVEDLRVDTFGHVYVMGTVSGGTHFDNDTTLPVNVEKRYFIVQYDTSGSFKWLRMPEADTTSHASETGQLFGMELDGAGNPNIIAFLPHSLLSGSNIVIPSAGTYILKYNPQGTLLSAIPPPGFSFPTSVNPNYYSGLPYANAQFYNFRLAHSPNGNWIMVGQFDWLDSQPSDFLINGQPVNRSNFIAAFDSQWQHLWHYLVDTPANFEGRPAIDAANNVYLTGGAWKAHVLFGDTIHNNGSGGLPFVAKLNSNGIKQWIANASDNGSPVPGYPGAYCHAVSSGFAITLNSGNEVAITGGCGNLKWGNYQILGECNTGYGSYIARFNSATGSITGLDSIIKTNSGYGDFGYSIAPGKNSSVFIGGLMRNGQYVNHDTLISAGGDADFFIAKFGFGCCATSPTSNFTSTATGTKTVQFTYTGTTTAIDSVVWDFGDGQKQKVTTGFTTPVTHTYATNGHYTASATVYSSCGTNTFSKNYALSVSSTVGLTGISVYPNPATASLTIEGMGAGGKATILSIVGQRVMSESITGNHPVLNISALAAGTYMLVLSNGEGVTGTVRFTKE